MIINTLKAYIAVVLTTMAIGFAQTAIAADSGNISGRVVVNNVKEDVLPIAEANGHVLLLEEFQGTNQDTGGNGYFEGARVDNKDVADLYQGNGPHRGYITLSKGADEVVAKWSGEVSTTMSKDGKPLTSFKGTWDYIAGTGHYAGINGSGRYSGHFTSKTAYVVDWKGRYTLPVAAK